MKIGFLQFEPALLNVNVNKAKVEELIKDKDFDLLVLPELANSGYLFSSNEEVSASSEQIPRGDFCRMLIKTASKNNSFIVSGICERAGDKYYNSSIMVYPSGEIKTYRKIHLFYEEKNWFSPGETPPEVFEIENNRMGKVKVGMMICFDWIFPETARTLALKGAQIICHPSNLVLPYCQKAMYTRAVENKVFTVTANRIGKESNGGKELDFTGESVIIDPEGNYLARGSADSVGLTVIDIDPSKANDKNITKLNNIFEDRRTDLYSV
jgi:predicted amidohydrolase